MLKKIFTVLFVFMFMCCSYSKVVAANDMEISNSYFSFTVPDDAKNTYSVEKFDNGVYVCEKVSKKSDMGGFAFGLKIYKSPSDYADLEDNKKIGELVDKNGIIYDMVLIKPTEIRYGDDEKIEKDFTRLYEYTNEIGENIKGVNGAKYFNNRGMKGEDLYGEVLKKYKTAFLEDWSYSKYRKEKLNCIYTTLSKSSKELLDKIGYVYYDINADGVDELIIGEISKSNSKGIIYDVYTMVDRKPTLVFSSSSSEKNFVCNDNLIWNGYSPKSESEIITICSLEKNSTKTVPQVVFKSNKKLDKNHKWSITYGIYGKPGFVTKKEFNERLKYYCSYKRFDYSPISKF